MEAKVSNLTNLETIKLFECHLTTKRRTNLNVHDVKHCFEKLFLPLFQLFCLAGQRQPIIYIFHYPSVRNVAKQVVVKQIRMSQIFDHHLPNRPSSPTAPVCRMMAWVGFVRASRKYVVRCQQNAHHISSQSRRFIGVAFFLIRSYIPLNCNSQRCSATTAPTRSHVRNQPIHCRTQCQTLSIQRCTAKISAANGEHCIELNENEVEKKARICQVFLAISWRAVGKHSAREL